MTAKFMIVIGKLYDLRHTKEATGKKLAKIAVVSQD